MNHSEQISILQAFRKVLSQEIHNVKERPDILWQQMYNRLQWADGEDGEGLVTGSIKPAMESRMKSGSKPWLRLKNILFESSNAILLTIIDQGNPVRSCDFSPDGKRILTVNSDQTVKIWDVQNGVEIKSLKSQNEEVNCCAFSPDGQFIVSGSKDNSLMVWDARTFKEVAKLTGHSDAVNSCAFSPDVETIVSVGDDNTVRFWDLKTYEELGSVETGYHPVTSCAYRPDGKVVVSTNDNGQIFLLDASGCEELDDVSVMECLNCCAFSPKGEDIVTGGDSGSRYHEPGIVFLSDNEKLECADSYQERPDQEKHEKEITSCAYCPDGSIVVTGGADNYLLLWDAVDLNFLGKLAGHTSAISACAYSPDGKLIASSSFDGTVKIWDAAMARNEGAFEDVFTGSVSSCAFNSDDSRLIAGSRDSSLIIYEALTGDYIYQIREIDSPVTCCGFSLDGKTIAVGTSGGALFMLDAGNYSGLTRLISPRLTIYEEEAAINAFAFSPDGEKIVAVSGKEDDAGEGNVILCDLKADKKNKIMAENGAWFSCKFSPDGRNLFWGGDGITFGDAEAMEKMDTIGSFCFDFALSPDGSVIASDFSNDTIKLLDAQTGKERVTLTGHTDSVNSIGFSPDGKTIISAGKDKTLRLWDSETGREKIAVKELKSEVWLTGFLPDGNKMVSASKDNVVRVWEAGTCELLAYFPFLGKISTCSLSHTGKFLAAGDSGGNVYILEYIGFDSFDSVRKVESGLSKTMESCEPPDEQKPQQIHMTMESITDILQRLKELSEQDEQHFFKYIDQVLMKDRLHLIKPHEIADLVMGTHNEPSAVSLLFDILGSHPDEPPRLAAGKILFAAVKSPYSKYEQKNIDVLTGCLESGMASDTQTIRNGCMWAMFKLTGTRAFEICSRVFLHHKPEVRLEIARLYGFLRDKRATPGLVMALEMESIPRIRSTILWALGYIKDPRATRILIDFLNDKNPEAGGYAAWALGEIGGIEAGMALAKVMTDESRNEEVRGWAAKAFLKTGIGKQSEITGETPQIMSSKDKAASITCKCGFSNSSTNRWCIQCGRELP